MGFAPCGRPGAKGLVLLVTHETTGLVAVGTRGACAVAGCTKTCAAVQTTDATATTIRRFRMLGGGGVQLRYSCGPRKRWSA